MNINSERMDESMLYEQIHYLCPSTSSVCRLRERGANENMNGLIRQYVPKGSSFEDLTDEYIELIQNKLNNRPRKRLGFLTPIEYFITKFAPDIKLNFNKVAFVT